jgi:exosortase
VSPTSLSGPLETVPARVTPTAVPGLVAGAAVVTGAAFAWTYWPVIPPLVTQWWNEDEYSHGFLIPIIAAWLIWLKREDIARQPMVPAYTGLAAMAGAIAMYTVGVVGADLFFQRLSMIPMIMGGVLFTAGWPVFRLIAFPLGYLILMVPLPGIVFNSIAFPLQLLAAQIATTILQAFAIPVFREGNILHLAAASLDVEEACSGVRSLLSLTALALLMTYITEKGRLAKIATLLLIVPVTIAANVVRVAATGFIAHHVSAEAALGTVHDFAGMLVFLLAAALLVAATRLLRLVGIR